MSHSVLLVLLAVVVVLLVGVLIAAIVFLVKLIRLWSVVNSPDMPMAGKVAFWGSAIYAVFPIDVLPDPVYLDDLGVLMGAVAYITGLARKNGLLGGGDRSGPRQPPQPPPGASRWSGPVVPGEVVDDENHRSPHRPI